MNDHDPLCHVMLPIPGGCSFCAFIARVRADERRPRTLTADDPEPAVGSVVRGRDRDGRWLVAVRQTEGCDGRGWVIVTPGSGRVPCSFADVTKYGPLRLIHDGGQA